MELLVRLLVGCLCVYHIQGTQYEPTWTSLDSRPLPSWYDQAKIGVFLHWGVYSVPSYGPGGNSGSRFWLQWKNSPPGSAYRKFMTRNYKPGFEYADFAHSFTAELFDPDQWAELFEAAGARYVVLTTKHHEGFCNWPTNVSFSWNSVDVGPHRDLVGELAASLRSRKDMRVGLYHSLYEFYNQLLLMDEAANFTTQHFSLGKTIPELKELINVYRPDLIWSDGDWIAGDDYWTSKQFLTWLYNESPVRDSVIVNDRWGKGCACKHGGYLTCVDRYNPKTLQKRKWENAMTLDLQSWGYRRNVELSSFMTSAQLIKTLAETISCGGNLLMNVGPTHDGRIIPIFEERLRQLGNWLKVNGEAVYGSTPWIYQNDTMTPDVWYTMKKSTKSESGYSVYAFILDWPDNNLLTLGAPVVSATTEVHLLGYETALKFYSSDMRSVRIVFPYIPPNKMQCEDGWVIRLDNLKII